MLILVRSKHSGNTELSYYLLIFSNYCYCLVFITQLCDGKYRFIYTKSDFIFIGFGWEYGSVWVSSKKVLFGISHSW